MSGQLRPNRGSHPGPDRDAQAAPDMAEGGGAAARAPVEPESGTSGFLINRRGPVKSRPSVFPRRSARPAVIARRSRARVQDRHGLLSRARTYSKGFSEDGSRKITQALWDQRSTDYPTGVRIWATYRGRRQY